MAGWHHSSCLSCDDSQKRAFRRRRWGWAVYNMYKYIYIYKLSPPGQPVGCVTKWCTNAHTPKLAVFVRGNSSLINGFESNYHIFRDKPLMRQCCIPRGMPWKTSWEICHTRPTKSSASEPLQPISTNGMAWVGKHGQGLPRLYPQNMQPPHITPHFRPKTYGPYADMLTSYINPPAPHLTTCGASAATLLSPQLEAS